jgi:hypothetical protein
MAAKSHLEDRHVRRLFDQTEQQVALRIELGAPRRPWRRAVRSPLARARRTHTIAVAIPISNWAAARLAGIPPSAAFNHTITQILALSPRHAPLHPKNGGLALFARVGNPFRNRKSLNVL